MDTKFYEEAIINHRAEKRDYLEEVEAIFDEFCSNENYKEWLLLISIYGTKHTSFLKDMIRISDEQNVPSEKDVDKCAFIFNAKNDKGQRVWPMSKKILDSVPRKALSKFIKGLKDFRFGTIEKFNRKDFIKYNLPIISIMDYALENKEFDVFYQAAQLIEPQYLQIYFDMNEDMKSYIDVNKDDEEIYKILPFLPQETFDKYMPDDFEKKLSKLSFDVIYTLIFYNKLYSKYIINKEFIKFYEAQSYDKQIILVNLLIGMDYPTEFIKKLRSKLNFGKHTKITENLPYDDIKRLCEEIKMSSYNSRYGIDIPKYFEDINEALNNGTLSKLFKSSVNYYDYLLAMHEKCMNYATSSIVDSLYDLSTLKDEVTYIDQEQYNILVRVKTFWDLKDLYESFKVRTFAGFSIINQNNFSHYPGDLLMGYYTGLDKDMIKHIFPIDSLSESHAKYSRDLTKKYNCLYNIIDLNEATYEQKTYNQICITTKDSEGNILKPNCAICTDESKLDETIEKAKAYNLKTLVLKRNPKTIEYSEDVYEKLK